MLLHYPGDYPMKHRFDVELDFITDLSPLELASRVAPLVREAVERVRQSLGTELEFDIFLVMDGRAVRFVMDGMERRIPVPPIEGRILHEHDLSRHPEIS